MDYAYKLYVREKDGTFLVGDTLPTEEGFPDALLKPLYVKGPFCPVGSPEMMEIADIDEWIKHWKYCGFNFSWDVPFRIAEKDTESAFIIFVPMSNLHISNEMPINGEWRVGCIDFVSKEAARRKEGHDAIEDSHADSFAVIEKFDSTKGIFKSIFKDVNEAKNILIASHAFLCSRSAHINCSISGYPASITRNCKIKNKDTGEIFSHSMIERTLSPISIDAKWLDKITNTTWLINLFEALKSPEVNSKWKMEIYRAAETIGRSLGAIDRANALFLNVVSMEILLTRPKERNAKDLTKRFECMFNWLGEDKPDFANDIERIYNVRHEIIHEGDYSKVSPSIIHLSDCYAHNALINVVSNICNFKSKNDQIVRMEGYNKSGSYPSTLKSQWFDYPYKSHLDGLSLW